MWQLVKFSTEKEQSIAILLESLDNTAKAESKLTTVELNRDEGMKLLILKLDSIFKSKTKDEALVLTRNFPDPVLVFKLLDGASISDDEHKLALALGKI